MRFQFHNVKVVLDSNIYDFLDWLAENKFEIVDSNDGETVSDCFDYQIVDKYAEYLEKV